MTWQSDTYRKTGKLWNKSWLFPPPCLKERCLDFVVQWLSLMKWETYGQCSSNDKPPAEFFQFDGLVVPEDLEQELSDRKY